MCVVVWVVAVVVLVWSGLIMLIDDVSVVVVVLISVWAVVGVSSVVINNVQWHLVADVDMVISVGVPVIMVGIVVSWDVMVSINGMVEVSIVVVIGVMDSMVKPFLIVIIMVLSIMIKAQ